ncbi:MAG TPA: GNAT family N-acetyltransferase [Galbitalea sp.]|jgi:GNAT superfamily N-acetyltransferase|nr:GNAT family N-acetyltransferase [Galbitalea sp.]
MDFLIRRIVEDDWAPYRDIRLAMLREIPMAYSETPEEVLGRGEADWRERAAAGGSTPGIRFAAITSAGEWIGSMGSYAGADGPTLMGVYVAPAFRGDAAGVTSALMAAVEDWAMGYSTSLRLDVHESNARAIASYNKRGYVATGNTKPYPPDPTHVELEMVKQLSSAPREHG